MYAAIVPCMDTHVDIHVSLYHLHVSITGICMRTRLIWVTYSVLGVHFVGNIIDRLILINSL